MWGLTYNSNLKRKVIFQKKAIKIAAKKSFNSPTDPVFRDLEVLKFSDVVLFHSGKFDFRIHLMTCLHWLIIFILKLVIVFTRAAPAFEDLSNTCIWLLLDIP